jgi:hypothetical protein
MTTSTTPMYVTFFIAVITILIAYFNLKTSREKFRLDLYNKRFEIYNKLMELYLDLPDNKGIESMSDNEKHDLKEFKKLKKSFVKYYRESKFLFKDESGVHSKIVDILKEINTVIDGKENSKMNSGLPAEYIIKRDNNVINARNFIELYMLDLEEAMKPYLMFHGEFGDIIIDFFELIYTKLQKYLNQIINHK